MDIDQLLHSIPADFSLQQGHSQADQDRHWHQLLHIPAGFSIPQWCSPADLERCRVTSVLPLCFQCVQPFIPTFIEVTVDSWVFCPQGFIFVATKSPMISLSQWVCLRKLLTFSEGCHYEPTLTENMKAVPKWLWKDGHWSTSSYYSNWLLSPARTFSSRSRWKLISTFSYSSWLLSSAMMFSSRSREMDIALINFFIFQLASHFRKAVLKHTRRTLDFMALYWLLSSARTFSSRQDGHWLHDRTDFSLPQEPSALEDEHWHQLLHDLKYWLLSSSQTVKSTSSRSRWTLILYWLLYGTGGFSLLQGIHGHWAILAYFDSPLLAFFERP